ncbi:hypothetical protein PRUB_a1472 [Pseudoalteromonas rubra]|uniref:Uncharacterized protein n=1 Tax=Pseudoalteromonas rubra TaxID=43658 RepID=A0A8T0C7W1_9GAMM|nr:hypothetical protein PRUB_a1472 [Pseudoalteromonas rubra]
MLEMNSSSSLKSPPPQSPLPVSGIWYLVSGIWYLVSTVVI